MDKQNLMPQVAQPVNRISTGQLSPELVELSEALQLHGDAAASATFAAVFASWSPIIKSRNGPGFY